MCHFQELAFDLVLHKIMQCNRLKFLVKIIDVVGQNVLWMHFVSAVLYMVHDNNPVTVHLAVCH